jgi:hypothetical protein
MMVLCILAGAGGLGTGCMSTIGMAFGEAMVAFVGDDPADPQVRMQLELQETNRQLIVPNILMTIFGFALSGCFLASGIGLLKAKPWSLKLVRNAVLAGIVYELLRGGLAVWMQTKNAPIMERFYRELAEKNQGPDMSQMMGVMMWGGLAVWAMWALTKIGLMVWGRIYAGSETAQTYIAEMNA